MMTSDLLCRNSRGSTHRIHLQVYNPFIGLPGLIFNGRRIPKLLSGSAQVWAEFPSIARSEAIPLELYPATNELLHKTPPDQVIQARKITELVHEVVKPSRVEFAETVDVDAKPHLGEELPDLIKSVSTPTTPVCAMNLQFPELQDDCIEDDVHVNQVSELLNVMKDQPGSMGSTCKEVLTNNEERQSHRDHITLQGRAVPGDVIPGGKPQQTGTENEVEIAPPKRFGVGKRSISRQDSVDQDHSSDEHDASEQEDDKPEMFAVTPCSGVTRSISKEGQKKVKRYSQADSGVGSDDSSRDSSFDSPQSTQSQTRKLSKQMSQISIKAEGIEEEPMVTSGDGGARHNLEEYPECTNITATGGEVRPQNPNRDLPSLPETLMNPMHAMDSIGASGSVVDMQSGEKSLTSSSWTESTLTSGEEGSSAPSYMIDGGGRSPSPSGIEQTEAPRLPAFDLMGLLSDDPDMDVKSQSSAGSYTIEPKRPRTDVGPSQPDPAMTMMTSGGYRLYVHTVGIPEQHTVIPGRIPTKSRSPTNAQLSPQPHSSTPSTPSSFPNISHQPIVSTPEIQHKPSPFSPMPYSPIHSRNNIEPTTRHRQSAHSSPALQTGPDLSLPPPASQTGTDLSLPLPQGSVLGRVPLGHRGTAHESQLQPQHTVSQGSGDPVMPSVDWVKFLEKIIREHMREMQEARVSPIQQIQFVQTYMSQAWPIGNLNAPQDQEMVSSALARAAADVFICSGSQDGAQVTLADSADSVATAPSTTESECTLTSDRVLRILQSAHQCGREDCVDADCIKGQDLLKQLSDSLHEERANWKPYILQILRLLFKHGCECDNQCTCTVPFCTFFHKYSRLDLESAINKLHRIVLRGLEGDIEPPTTNDRLHQITYEPPPVPMAASHGMPEQGITYRIVLPNRPFYLSDNFMATPTIQPGQYWNIRRMRHSVLPVLAELRRPQHNVIQHLWAIQNPRDLVVFQMFAGNSLDDYLQYQYLNGAPIELTWIILEHVLLGTEYLQSQNILFMNWDGHAITVDMTRASLTDFSRAINVTSSTLDDDQIQNYRMAMNPFVIAPEMFEDTVFLASTDCWGVGLIGHLVSTGRILYHRFRHMPPDQASLNVRANPLPSRPLPSDPRLTRFFDLCLQVNPNRRQAIYGLLLFVQESRQILCDHHDETEQKQDSQR